MQTAPGSRHKFSEEDGQTPGNSFNISADAVRDTDGSNPMEDLEGGQGAQSQLVKRLFPEGAAPGGVSATGVVASALQPLVQGSAAPAGGVAMGGAEKRSAVQIPGMAVGGVGKRVCVNGEAAADAAEEDEEAGGYEEAPFALMWIRMKMPRPFNHGCFGVKLRQVVCGNIELAVVSNYMMDVKWLVSACPDLRRARRLLLLHGEARSRMRSSVSDAGLSPAVQVRPQWHLYPTSNSTTAFDGTSSTACAASRRAWIRGRGSACAARELRVRPSTWDP